MGLQIGAPPPSALCGFIDATHQNTSHLFKGHFLFFLFFLIAHLALTFMTVQTASTGIKTDCNCESDGGFLRVIDLNKHLD